MNETNVNPPTVYVSCTDDACRRRATEIFRHEWFGGRIVVLDEDQPSPRDQPNCVELLFYDANRIGYGAIDAQRAFVFPLATSSGDETLRATATLLVEIAALRGSLAAARQSEDALQQLAATDPLTGLANRRAWDDELIRQCRAAATRDESLTVAVLDLDEFKQVNDVHGHAVGDAVLKATADGLRHAVRRGDLAARIGGDEFGLLLPGLSMEAAALVVERIRLAAVAAVTAAGLPATTCSLGFAAEQGSAAVTHRLYAAAAAALQTAKRAGRDRSAS